MFDEHGQSGIQRLVLWISTVGIAVILSIALFGWLSVRSLINLNRATKELDHTARLRKTFASKVLEAQEQERLHIARELHDVLGQMLTVLKMGANRIMDHAQEAIVVKESAEELGERLDQSLDVITKLTGQLRPPLLDSDGFCVAVESLAADLGKLAGLQCEVDISPDAEDMPSEVLIVLYRITQEALTNVMRHSGAKQVRITMLNKGELKIEDDGRGIPEHTMNDLNAFGLSSMRERAELIGGKLVITSGKGGCTVAVTWRHPTR